jgi:hypothetical protein
MHIKLFLTLLCSVGVVFGATEVPQEPQDLSKIEGPHVEAPDEVELYHMRRRSTIGVPPATPKKVPVSNEAEVKQKMLPKSKEVWLQEYLAKPDTEREALAKNIIELDDWPPVSDEGFNVVMTEYINARNRQAAQDRLKEIQERLKKIEKELPGDGVPLATAVARPVGGHSELDEKSTNAQRLSRAYGSRPLPPTPTMSAAGSSSAKPATNASGITIEIAQNPQPETDVKSGAATASNTMPVMQASQKRGGLYACTSCKPGRCKCNPGRTYPEKWKYWLSFLGSSRNYEDQHTQTLKEEGQQLMRLNEGHQNAATKK